MDRRGFFGSLIATIFGLLGWSTVKADPQPTSLGSFYEIRADIYRGTIVLSGIHFDTDPDWGTKNHTRWMEAHKPSGTEKYGWFCRTTPIKDRSGNHLYYQFEMDGTYKEVKS